jgi:hypothetical protein
MSLLYEIVFPSLFATSSVMRCVPTVSKKYLPIAPLRVGLERSVRTQSIIHE